MNLKLGKRPATPDPRDFKLGRYVSWTNLPAIPKSDTANTRRISDWQMLGNDTVGDCVFAGADHETMLWTLEGGHPAPFNARSALADYAAVTGYDPADPNTDQGTVVRDALNYRRNVGLVDAQGNRHRVGAFVALEPGNRTHVEAAVHLFDAVGIGFEVPDYALDQFDRGQTWHVPSRAKPNIVGGHYVPVIGYDPRYLHVVSWGRVQRMSWAFFHRFCDEAWGLLSEEMLRDGRSPDGLNLDRLKADLTELAQGGA